MRGNARNLEAQILQNENEAFVSAETRETTNNLQAHYDLTLR